VISNEHSLYFEIGVFSALNPTGSNKTC